MGTVQESQHEKKYYSRRKETVGQSQTSKNLGIRRNETVEESRHTEKRNSRRIATTAYSIRARKSRNSIAKCSLQAESQAHYFSDQKYRGQMATLWSTISG
uniref:Uncharacterized protein n=1 Tax=Romanomermis culicivorax TaxID=13658 RepID=A0A915HTF9_ROMCU